ncbi:uncharacterized protein BP5553_01076 [Venustampulla echinocandica]|uniref:Extracellular membrane protein CFEM domain-containing protein n=1 Tax=Venustampulla echinocandica TaxID=2656787 RepID=A0A370U011_9HELO|nr:uncharacterized protein BP5553_01076 [Venustampulla echinocandica]RDL41097.1 hypothetical protein BP5553_01076 [Venustampulla echinocandica]
MRFATVVLSVALAAVSVHAQNATTVPAVSSSVALSPAQSSQATCLSSCAATDPACRAKCIVIPEGDYAQQNRTIDCISECPKGNGTATDDKNFLNCQKGCLASATITPSSTPAATGTGKSGAGNTSGGAKPTGTATDGSEVSASGSGSSPAATSSKSAADNVHLGISVAGVVGLFAAVFAL